MEYPADFESSAEARETWFLKNNITTLDPNSLNDVLGQQKKPCINDPVNDFKQVKMSNLVLLKLVMEAGSHECTRAVELFKLMTEKNITGGVGLFLGKISDNAIIVADVVPLPVEDTESSVDVHSKLLHYYETQEKLGGLENVVGWYRTSLIDNFVEPSDVKTQMRIQELKESSFAVVIDSMSTTTVRKVSIHPFRTYPESYKPPVRVCGKGVTPAEAAQIYEVVGHLEKCYPLCITYFKSWFDNYAFQKLWESYWARLVYMWNNDSKTVDPRASFDNKEDDGGPIKYSVCLKYKFTKQYSSSAAAVKGIYAGMVEGVGCSATMIRTQSTLGFSIALTKEQAKKLAENECVQAVCPAQYIYHDPYH
ncbi:hypothetical protein KSS87_019154 [Heliosperma pusillum]|nr:hypothetical protein KSS87_019154 [Heliosperma pusillum]